MQIKEHQRASKFEFQECLPTEIIPVTLKEEMRI